MQRLWSISHARDNAFAEQILVERVENSQRAPAPWMRGFESLCTHSVRRSDEQVLKRSPARLTHSDFVAFMQRNDPFADLMAKMSELLGANPAQDVERNFRALVGSALGRLELVPREEFDVQARVLSRARERLAVLEARVAELERQLTAAR
jgi:BMFP domain-containing protein YqiC